MFNLLDSPLCLHIQWSQKVFGHYLDIGLYNKTSNQVTFENTVFRTSLSLVFFVWFLVSSCYLLTKVTWFDNLQTNAMASIYFAVWLKCPNTSLGTVCEKYPNYSIIFRFRSCIISHFCFSSIISVFVNAWSMYCFSRMQFGIHIIIYPHKLIIQKH